MSVGEKISWDINFAIAGLDQQQSKNASVERQFEEVYLKVRETLARQVPLKEIVRVLRAAGMPLSPARLNKLLEHEAKRRPADDSGTPRVRRPRVARKPVQSSPTLLANEGEAS